MDLSGLSGEWPIGAIFPDWASLRASSQSSSGEDGSAAVRETLRMG
jgi:hypothetical protein